LYVKIYTEQFSAIVFVKTCKYVLKFGDFEFIRKLILISKQETK